KLGKYVVLRDVYGDVFTYAGLGSIAPTYIPAKAPHRPVKSPVADVGSAPTPTPSLPASAGSQLPLTLHVKTPVTPGVAGAAEAGVGQALSSAGSAESTPAG